MDTSDGQLLPKFTKWHRVERKLRPLFPSPCTLASFKCQLSLGGSTIDSFSLCRFSLFYFTFRSRQFWCKKSPSPLLSSFFPSLFLDSATSNHKIHCSFIQFRSLPLFTILFDLRMLNVAICFVSFRYFFEFFHLIQTLPSAARTFFAFHRTIKDKLSYKSTVKDSLPVCEWVTVCESLWPCPFARHFYSLFVPLSLFLSRIALRINCQ